MSIQNTSAGRFGTQVVVSPVRKATQRPVFDVKNAPMVGTEHRAEEPILGYYNLGNRIKRR